MNNKKAKQKTGCITHFDITVYYPVGLAYSFFSAKVLVPRATFIQKLLATSRITDYFILDSCFITGSILGCFGSSNGTLQFYIYQDRVEVEGHIVLHPYSICKETANNGTDQITISLYICNRHSGLIAWIIFSREFLLSQKNIFFVWLLSHK